MKKYIFFIHLFLAMFVTPKVQAQFTEKNEIAIIAQNWIQIIIDKYGHWGESETAIAGNIQELRDSGKLIGYYCPVQPKGFIVFSLRRELAPVKVYSDRRNIDFSKDQGMPELIKYRISRIIKSIESKVGPIESAASIQVGNLLESTYYNSWDFIEIYSTGSLQSKRLTDQNYVEGDSLVHSQWHQRPPYNNFCPDLSCSTSNGRALVGCVATAGAQIMKYWNWPPNGNGGIYNDTYEWTFMYNSVNTLWPQSVQDAVAELSFEVGDAVGMNYGCDVSTAWNSSMESAFESNFRYDNLCNSVSRTDYTADDWFILIQNQINQNRPIYYSIGKINEPIGHSIVCDGWQITGSLKLYHMNFGWDNNTTTWYTLDMISDYDWQLDMMIRDIVPNDAVGATMAGTYNRTSYAYRYFDQDTQGSLATFSPGQSLQVLPEIIITGTGDLTNVRIEAVPGLSTQLFTEGDPEDGIHIYNGAIQLRNGGSIKLR